VKIELDLNQLIGVQYDNEGEEIGNRSLREEVVSEISRVLIKDTLRDVRNDVAGVVKEVVQSQIAATVTAAMEKPIQTTSQWGEKQGAPMSLLELIRTQLEAFLNNKTRGRDSYNREPGNLKDLVDDAARSVLTKELQAEIDKVRKQINTQIEQHALKAAAAALTKGLKV
jgi:flagellar biosynthesis/type III secretory pathway protein FliH